MKKILCVLLAALFLNVPVYAEDNNYISEDIVARAKEVCDISDDYNKMNVDSISKYGDMTMYGLSWKITDDKYTKSEITVSIGSDGLVYMYSFNASDLDYLSKDMTKIYTDKQARETAEAFMREALKDKYASLEYDGVYNENNAYRFRYSIKSGDIPYYNRKVSIWVNKFSCYIESYDYNFSVLRADDIGFDGAKSIDEARQSVLENMRLGYDTEYDYGEKNYTVTPLYRPKSCILDAYTLKSPETSELYEYASADTASGEGVSNSRKTLTEAEIKGIEESRNVLSLENAAALYNDIFGRNISTEDIEADYTREERSNYYITRISSKPENEEQFYADFDVWGRLLNYYTPYYYENENEYHDYEREKKCAEDFIKKLNIKYSLSEIEENNGTYYTNVIRNGIISFDEKIGIRFDKDMNIISFHAQYYPDDIYNGAAEIKEDKAKALAAAEKLYPLTRYYLLKEEYTKNKPIYETIPVYAFENSFSVNASTMEVLNYYGESIEKNEGIHTYTDLNGQWYAEYAEKLAYMGYSFDNDEFGGDADLTLGEFRQFMNGSYLRYINYDSLFEERDDSYVMSRYDIAEVLTNGIAEVTKYSDIFVKPYEDVDDEHRGAVAVLKAAGVVTEKDNFRGNDSITRGEMAVMIYRYVNSVNKAGELSSPVCVSINRIVI